MQNHLSHRILLQVKEARLEHEKRSKQSLFSHLGIDGTIILQNTLTIHSEYFVVFWQLSAGLLYHRLVVQNTKMQNVSPVRRRCSVRNIQFFWCFVVSWVVQKKSSDHASLRLLVFYSKDRCPGILEDTHVRRVFSCFPCESHQTGTNRSTHSR